MTTDYQKAKKRKYANAIARFTANKDHHDMTLDDLSRMYGVPEQFVRTDFLPIAGRLPPHEAQRIRDEACKSHPMFGKPDERAPCPHNELSRITGVPSRTISTMRRAARVLNNNPKYDRDRTVGRRRYRLTREDRKIYNLCALTKTWGRPAGVAAFLAALEAR